MVMERRTTHFSGHVQGVGFRYTTLRIARELPVTGYVENLADGRVKLVAEAESDVLETLQREIESAMQGYIRDVSFVESSATAEFREFCIRS